jgi:hypothetical protein
MALIRDSNFQGAPLAMMPNYLRNFRLSHQLLTPFELYLVILYLLQTSKHWIESILQCTSDTVRAAKFDYMAEQGLHLLRWESQRDNPS